jgi:hypothetical protein
LILGCDDDGGGGGGAGKRLLLIFIEYGRLSLGRALELTLEDYAIREGGFVSNDEREEAKICLGKMVADGFLHKPALMYEGMAYGTSTATASSSSRASSTTSDNTAKRRKSAKRGDGASTTSTTTSTAATTLAIDATTATTDGIDDDLASSMHIATVDKSIAEIYRVNCAQFIGHFQRKV